MQEKQAIIGSNVKRLIEQLRDAMESDYQNLIAQANLQASERFAYPFEEGIELIGLGRTTAFEEAKEGRLRTYWIGRKRFITREALIAYVREREAEVSAPASKIRAPM